MLTPVESRSAVFRDILVMPTQDLGADSLWRKMLFGRGVYRGGPLWPGFSWRFGARTCRGRIPRPCDRRPRVDPAVAPESVEAGIWCGPAWPHYGHMIADFGMRIAAAGRHHPSLPLVFSLGPGEAAQPAPFFPEILAHLGVAAERVLLVRRPTRFRRLLVPPQAERLDGPEPDRNHLDLMDALTLRHGPQAQDLDHLFVSRALYPDGRLAGESYLVEALARAGATVIFPETLPLAEQIAHYRRARHIVFSEGSAVHTLQLLGRLEADVTILVRRPGKRIARAAIRPRVRSLDYWDIARQQLCGLMADGRPQANRALALFDEADLLKRFARIGLDLYDLWSYEDYYRRLIDDAAFWIAYNRSWNLHPNVLPTLRHQISELRLPINVDEAWRRDILQLGAARDARGAAASRSPADRDARSLGHPDQRVPTPSCESRDRIGSTLQGSARDPARAFEGSARGGSVGPG